MNTQNYNRTILMIKPGMGETIPKNIAMDCVEELKLNLTAILTIQPSIEMMREFYKIHQGKPFFEELVRYMSSGPCYIYYLKGANCINTVRSKLGSTNPEESADSTWRKQYGKSITENVAHASDSPEAYDHETKVLVDYIVN